MSDSQNIPTAGAAARIAAPPRQRAAFDDLRAWAFLAAGAVALLVPPIVRLSQESWATEQGAHGPIILASGLWLFFREWHGVGLRPGYPMPTVLAILPALAIYIFASIIGMTWVWWISCCCAVMAAIYGVGGFHTARKMAFPILYLMCVVPPERLLAPISGPMNAWLAQQAASLLYALGFEVAQDGTTLYIDQYELRMVQACAGLNSLFSLVVLGMFYLYLRHGSVFRNGLVFIPLLIPIAIFANLCRVLLLTLTTVWFGDAVAQGPVHDAAGLFMFFVALLCLLGLDALLSATKSWERR